MNATGSEPSSAPAISGSTSKELDDIESRVGKVTVPLSYAGELYSLRSHISMVRRPLDAAGDDKTG